MERRVATEAGGRARRRFVGREAELLELTSGLGEAREGRGGLYLIAGEPGIGKSRLADALCEEAREAGAAVHWGRCWEGGGAPAYWPWTQILRPLVADRDAGSLAEQLGPRATYLAQLVPELASGDRPQAHSEDARFALFAAVSSFLKEACGERPLVLVLDDLHAADAASLLLLEFLAHDLRDSRILAIGTYREVEARRRPEAAQALTAITRAGTRIPLRGLRDQDVARLVEEAAGRPGSEDLVRTLRETTAGNPFFVDEVVRLLVAEQDGHDPGELSGTRLAIPNEVREVVRQRLEPLSPEAREVLALGALIGREFSLPQLAPAAGRSPEELLVPIEEAEEQGVLYAARGAVGRYSFSHALVRETVQGDLPSHERIALHKKVGEALERLYASDPEPHLAELAHHFGQVAPLGEVEKGVEYAARAGERSLRQLAYEEAAAQFDRALTTLDLDPDADPARRCELTIWLGEALWSAGDLERAKESFRRAAELAEELGDHERLARAALGRGGPVAATETGGLDEPLIALLEKARRCLPDEPSALRARVMARLAEALVFGGDVDRRMALARDAVEMARGAGDKAALVDVLMRAHWATWSPDNLEQRLAATHEIAELAEEVGEPRFIAQAHEWRFAHLLEAGDMRTAKRELAVHDARAEELRQPYLLWTVAEKRATLALLEGRLDQVEELASEAFEIGQRGQNVNAVQTYGVHILLLRRLAGGLEEVIGGAEHFADLYPAVPTWRAGLAAYYPDLGRHSEARREWEVVAAQDFADFPRDVYWLVGMAVVAEACADLGDARRAPSLYELLRPFADRCAMAPAALCMGSMSRYLGLVAATMDRFDLAEEHFQAALAQNTRMGARVWAAHVEHDWARMLARRDGPGDREAALERARTARELARGMGMGVLERKAAALEEELGGGVDAEPAAPATGAAEAGAGTAKLRLDGEYWTVGFAGSEFRLKDSKGLHYLARLLERPGVDLHATDFLDAPAEPAPGAAAEGMTVRAGEDAGELLDPEAKAQYKARLDELREEIEEAERFHDPERASRAREEMEFVGGELARAVGLGGRDRKAASTSERARVNVTRAIKSVIKRIDEHDPRLGRHLEAAVRTGTFCRYEPERAEACTWEIQAG